jgi:hypothetical protein
MKRSHNAETALDRALTEIREEPIASEEVNEVAARVLDKLATEYNKIVPYPAAVEAQSSSRIQSCRDFQNLIPAYLSSNLTESRKLLFENHIRECITCLKAIDAIRRGPVSLPKVLPDVTQRLKARKARLVAGLAAALLFGLGLTQTDFVRDLIWPIDVHATAQNIDGGLFSVAGQTSRSLAVGERIERHQSIRTGNGSGVVLRLADGSRVEMGARSELFLDRTRDGVRINLERGTVIVAASKQKNGHLYVATKDCTVSVVGTVFSVNSSAKGSRVSVIQGEVQVRQGGKLQELVPGQQISTNPDMSRVPLQQEIAWSPNAEAYSALLKELVTFSQHLTTDLQSKEMRHVSNLVPLVPETTSAVASLPNASQSLAQSYSLLKQRIDENPALRQWWAQNARTPDRNLTLDEMVARVVQVGAYLGPEIILAFASGSGPAPVLLADAAQPARLMAALEDDLARLTGLPDQHPGVRLVRSVAELEQIDVSSNRSQLLIGVDGNLMAVAANANQLRTIFAFHRGLSRNAFITTALYRRLEQAYSDGVGWLLAVDLETLVRPAGTEIQRTGLADARQLIIEQKTGSAGASYLATLGFNGTRHGVAAWLAEPAPMGALEFVSPNAFGVAGVITKDPTLILDDLLAMVRTASITQDLDNLQRGHRVDIRYDLAEPLGNEFLFASDGPILPTPSWKVIVEVNDAARLQNSLTRIISEINREAAARQRPTISLSSESVSGRTYYNIKIPGLPTSIHYTFWAGYMILAPTRALVLEAIQIHDGSDTLARSERFRSQLPSDGRDYTSGFVYQNFQGITNALPVQKFGTITGALPTLICLYGEADHIVLSSRGMLATDIVNLAGLAGMMHAVGVR